MLNLISLYPSLSTGMQVMNALPNSDMPAVAASLQVAQAWVDTHVVPYLPHTHITAIAVSAATDNAINHLITISTRV